MRKEQRARLLLGIGTALGIALAAAGTVVGVGQPGRLPAGAIASVNGVAIPADLYERTLAGLAADKRNPLREEDRRYVLERLIQEELLVQRGVEVGLVESEPQVRKAIVGEMIQSVLADVESEVPSEADLRKFYAEERAYFTPGPRLRVEELEFRGPSDGGGSPRARAGDARAALLAGEAERARGLADAPVVPVPDALLPPRKLREYLGPTLLEAAQALPTGSWSEPLQAPGGVALVRVLEREEPEPPAFEAVADQVEVEYRRRQGDRALREYLDRLHDEADVTIAPDAPQ